MDTHFDIVVIGAGVAGLTATYTLQNEGFSVALLEKTDRVGGRVKTDHHSGFLLDRGFQIFLPAYPEAQRMLNDDALDLNPFHSGAHIYQDDDPFLLYDPRRHPVLALQSLKNPAYRLNDLRLLMKLYADVRARSYESFFQDPDKSTLSYLKSFGFRQEFIDRFFRPFFSGIFLDNSLETSSQLFLFLFQIFSSTTATLPTQGIEAISRQLEQSLDDGTVFTDTCVVNIEENTIHTDQGKTFQARRMINATNHSPGEPNQTTGSNSWNHTTCYYFSLESPPVSLPTLHLIAGSNPINSFCFPSLVQDSYSPDGKHLASVSSLWAPDRISHEIIKDELKQIFGDQIESWEFLRSYEIKQALPKFEPKTNYNPRNQPPVHNHLCRAGDSTTTPSLNGAMRSGRLAAEAIKTDLLRE